MELACLTQDYTSVQCFTSILLRNHFQGQIQPSEYAPLSRQEYGSIFERDLLKPAGHKVYPTMYELVIMKCHYVLESIKGYM